MNIERFNSDQNNTLKWALNMLDIKPDQFEINRVKASYRQLLRIFHLDKIQGSDKLNLRINEEYTAYSAIINNSKDICLTEWNKEHPERVYTPFSPKPRDHSSNVFPAGSRDPRRDPTPPPRAGKGRSDIGKERTDMGG